MDRLQGAAQCQSSAKLVQGEVRLAAEESTHLLIVEGQNLGFPPGPMMAGRDLACVSPLLQKLFDHTKGNSKSPGNFFTGSLLFVVGIQNSFAQIQRRGSHEPIYQAAKEMATVLFKLL